jgi:predicted ATPase
LDHVRERGLIAVENGTWQIRVPLETIELQAPESLRQLIELQIERLSEAEQRALEAASITGVSFTAHADKLDAPGDREKFENLCEELSRRQHLVRRTGSQQFPDGSISQCYEFAHALYREVFYRRQAPGRRAKLQWICRPCVAGSTATP